MQLQIQEELDLRDIKDSHGIWAPDINYVDGKFIIMATLRLNGDGKRDNNVLRRQLVVTSDKPQGYIQSQPYLRLIILTHLYLLMMTVRSIFL